MSPTFSLNCPPGIYIVLVDRRTTLMQAVLMKMSRVLDDEQDCHTTTVALSWASSDVNDWMVNPLSTSTAYTAIINSSQRSTCIEYTY